MSAEVQKYAKLLNQWPGGCVLLENGVVSAANDEAIESLGIPRGHLVGVPVADILVPEFTSEWHEALSRPGRGTRAVAVRLAKGLSPVEFTVRPLSDNLAAMAVRSMTAEYRYSALAAADLTHDQVTGLPDRYHVLSQLRERLASPQRHPLALIALWIDDLPSLAAAHGDRVVDRVAWEVSQRLQNRLRSPDILGRFDPAGYLTLLTSDSPPAQLTDIADRLREEVAFPVDVDASLVSFTASVAVASIVDRRPSIERTLAQLEAAATRASSGGGNRTEVLDL